MSEPFRTRRFVPVPAGQRPRRSRRAARVVVTDGDAVLLLADTDPGLPGSRWWVVPGGGIDPGESSRQAAVRELAEETGLLVGESGLIGPVAAREVVHGYSDQILSQHEDFFVVRVPQRFTPDPAGLTPDEQVTLDGWGWHRIADLATLADPVWPANLAALLLLAESPGRLPHWLGQVEESTLPVGS